VFFIFLSMGKRGFAPGTRPTKPGTPEQMAERVKQAQRRVESRERKRQAELAGVKLKRGRPKKGQAPPTDLLTMSAAPIYLPPRQARPQPPTTQSPVAAALAPCEGFTVAYFVDKDGSYKHTSELIASVVKGCTLVSMDGGGEAGFAKAVAAAAHSRCTTLWLVGHGGSGSMGPSSSSANTITAEKLMRALINGAPLVSEIVLLCCNAEKVATALKCQWDMRQKEQRLNRRMGIVGVGAGDHVKLDLKDLTAEVVEREQTAQTGEDVVYSQVQLECMKRVVTYGVDGAGGVSAAAVAVVVLLQSFGGCGTVQHPELSLAQLTVPVADRNSGSKGTNIRTSAAAGIFKGDPFAPWQLQCHTVAAADKQKLDDLFNYFQLVFGAQIALPEYRCPPPAPDMGARVRKTPAQFVPGSNDNAICSQH
jgi:hypothetical protein